MHVYAHEDVDMRTTLEIRNDQRARLLEIAASRGHKGFSFVVQEAIDLYLEQVGEQNRRIGVALAMRGALSDEEADAFEARAAALRGSWR